MLVDVIAPIRAYSHHMAGYEQRLEAVLGGATSELARAAASRAIARVEHAAAVVLVEGVSDQIAVETLGAVRGDDMAGIGVFPTGGVHAFGPFIKHFGPRGRALRLSGLCDAAEAGVVHEALVAGGMLDPSHAIAESDFHICDRDLEDELIRALGVDAAVAVIDEQGDLHRLRTMQHQPEWRNRPTADQIRRFLGSGARRKLRYAAAFVRAMPPERAPTPLREALDAVVGA